MKNCIRNITLAAALCVVAGASASTITVKGSDTLVILAQKWAESYMSKHPDTKIQVTGGGSGIGIAALQYKSTDLCDSSRLMNTDEIAGCIAVCYKMSLP